MKNRLEVRQPALISPMTRPFIGAAHAENTAKAYRSDFADFADYCHQAGVDTLPSAPGTVADYLSSLAARGKKASTIERRRSAIRTAHVVAGHADPTSHPLVKAALKGIKRTIGVKADKKAPVLTVDVIAMTSTLDSSLKGLRDKALLLIGFSTGMRRSELISLDVDNIELVTEGLRINIRRSKTDQFAEGRLIGVTRGSDPVTCPVRALSAYLSAAGVTEGAIFRSINRHGHVGSRLTAQSVALIVKAAAKSAGLDQANYAGHSLRAGLVTQAAIAGVSAENIMRQTGHVSHHTVMGYIRIANVFENNASANIGL